MKVKCANSNPLRSLHRVLVDNKIKPAAGALHTPTDAMLLAARGWFSVSAAAPMERRC